MRETLLFNEGWLFHKGDIESVFPTNKGAAYIQAKTERYHMGPASIRYQSATDSYSNDTLFNADKWEWVTLPHDYVVFQKVSTDYNNALGYLKYDNAWYRKLFTIESIDKEKRITLEFDGIATNATIYFNGVLLKHNFCGYNSFEVDITDFVKFDEENVLAVYVNTQNHEGWWYEGGGIYRSVRLVKTEKISVDRYGVYVVPEKISDTRWNVNYELTLVSINDKEEDVVAKIELIDAEGKTVDEISNIITAKPNINTTESFSTTIDNPVLWDIDNPYQYTIKTTILKNNVKIDEYSTKTGFRYFRCTANEGFVLNDKPVKIMGVCNHEDCGLFGKAVPENIHRYRMQMIKEMGANGYRTSHYQQNAAILDAADDLGFIVFDEARWFSSSDEAKEQLRELVKRDRNRPSVFFWSLSNEEPCHLTEMGKRITRTLMAEVESLDKTRVVTSAVSNDPEVATVFDLLDVIGINYNFPIYEKIRKTYPEKPLISSENCATGTTRGWYYDDCAQKGYRSAYDKDTDSWFRSREHTWKCISAQSYIMGGYQWTAFDHRGETVWPRLCSASGAIDMYMQKKDAFYQNQSFWIKEPMIHMLPHWDIEAYENQNVKVWAYTNCQEAELLINGKSYGRQTIEPYFHAEWNVPYEKGRAEVIGYIDGTEAARDIKETSKEPKRLMLRLENKIKKTGDVAIVTCYTLDEDGRFVANATPTVEFFTNKLGRVVSTGSDNTDHRPIAEPTRKMWEGYISVAIGINTNNGCYVDEKGAIRLYARAEGLEPAMLEIRIG